MEIILNRDENQADARLEITISLADVEEDVNKAIKEMRQKINLPGFRQGMVPMSIAKKLVYEQTLADQLDKKLESTLNQYFADHQLEVIKPVLPVQPEKPIDLKNDTEFRFTYDLGIINIQDFSEDEILDGLERFEIEVSDAEIEKEIERVRFTYADYKQFENVPDDPEVVVYLSLKELDENGNLLENGFITTKIVKWAEAPQQIKNFLKDKKVNEEFEFPIRSIFPETEELVSFLQQDKEIVEDLNDVFKARIINCSKNILPEMNQEFFLKATNNKHDNEEGFREYVKEILQERLKHSAEHLLDDEILERLKSMKLTIPEKYIQRLFEEEQAEKIKDMDRESEEYIKLMSEFTASVKWSAILEYLIKKYGLKADDKEVIYETYNVFSSYLMQTGQSFRDDKDMSNAIVGYLKEKRNYLAMEQRVLTGKIIEQIRSLREIPSRKIISEEFNEIFKHKHKEHGH